MEWTYEQYVRRILVVCAKELGQRIDVIAKSPFALTLWTYYELMAMEEEERVRRLGERTDMAGLVAVAFHQPADLHKMEMRYLKAAGQLSHMMDDARERMKKMMQAHQSLQPVTRGDTDG